MRSLFVQVALFFGLDPFTFVVLLALAAVCAFLMKEMMPDPWMAFAFMPLLFAGGLAFVGVASLLGIAEPVEIWIDHGGDLRADWKRVGEAVPAIVIAGMAGMCAAALAIIELMRRLGAYI